MLLQEKSNCLKIRYSHLKRDVLLFPSLNSKMLSSYQKKIMKKSLKISLGLFILQQLTIFREIAKPKRSSKHIVLLSLMLTMFSGGAPRIGFMSFALPSFLPLKVCSAMVAIGTFQLYRLALDSKLHILPNFVILRSSLNTKCWEPIW